MKDCANDGQNPFVRRKVVGAKDLSRKKIRLTLVRDPMSA